MASGKWQVASAGCHRGPKDYVVSFTHSCRIRMRNYFDCIATVQNVGGNSHLSSVPHLPTYICFFFTVSSPVLCKLLLWQHVALVFMAGWPLRSVPIRLMTLGPRPGMMMMMVLVIISYEYRYLLLLLLLTQLPLAVIDHQSAGIVSTLYLGTLGRVQSRLWQEESRRMQRDILHKHLNRI